MSYGVESVGGKGVSQEWGIVYKVARTGGASGGDGLFVVIIVIVELPIDSLIPVIVPA